MDATLDISLSISIEIKNYSNEAEEIMYVFVFKNTLMQNVNRHPI